MGLLQKGLLRHFWILSIFFTLLASSTLKQSFAVEAHRAGEYNSVIPINEIIIPPGYYSPELYSKVAVIQWAPVISPKLGVSNGEAKSYVTQNRRKLETFIREAHAQRAVWILTPEFATVGYPDTPNGNYRNKEDIRPYAETIPGPSTRHFSNLARELGIYLHIGLPEMAEPGRYFNTVVVLNPDGKIIAKHRKMNLFTGDGDYLESGTQITTYSAPWGKTGVIICADVYGSGIMEKYRKEEVRAVGMSASWAMSNSGMGFFQRGAAAAQAYMAASNHDYFPDSGVINPDGSLQSHIRQTTGIAYGFIRK